MEKGNVSRFIQTCAHSFGWVSFDVIFSGLHIKNITYNIIPCLCYIIYDVMARIDRSGSVVFFSVRPISKEFLISVRYIL